MCPHLGSPEKLSGYSPVSLDRIRALGSCLLPYHRPPTASSPPLSPPGGAQQRYGMAYTFVGGHMAASRYFPVIAVLSSLDVPARSVLERLRRERGRNVCRRAINDARYAKNRGRKRPRGNLAGSRLSRAPLRGRAIASGCAPSRHGLCAISSSLSALSFHDTRRGRDPGTRVWSTPQKLNHNKIDSLC